MNVGEARGPTAAATGLAALLALAAPAQAAHPLSTDDAGTVGAAGVEIEVSSLFGGAEAPEAAGLELGAALHVGLTDALDAGVSLALQTVADGKADVAMGAPLLDLKWRVLEAAGAAPGLTLRIDYAPMPDTGVGYDVGGVLVATLDLAPVEVHMNVGAHGRSLGAPEARFALCVGAASLVSVSSTVQLGAEAAVEGDPSGELGGVSGMAAVAWEVAEARVLSAGAGPTWSADQPVGWVATVGFTASFPH